MIASINNIDQFNLGLYIWNLYHSHSLQALCQNINIGYADVASMP